MASYILTELDGNVEEDVQEIFYHYDQAVGLNENNSELTGFVYPNPTNGMLNIQSSKELLSVKIINSLGQILIEQKNASSIDMSEMKAGIYFIHLNDGLRSRVIQVSKM